MKPIRPPQTPRGLAFTPAYALEPGARLLPLGLVTPERDGAVSSSIAQQTLDCFANLEDLLARAGATARAVKMTLLMTDVREVWNSNSEFDSYFSGDRQNPAKTLLEVPACSTPGARFEMDVWAVTDADGEPVSPPGDVRVLHGEAGDQAGHGIDRELDACLDQLHKELSDGSSAIGDIAKLTVHLADIADWPRCRDRIAARFGDTATAVVPLAVTKVGQVGARVELTAWVSAPARPLADEDPTLLAISGSAAIPMYVGGDAADIYKYQPEADVRAQAEVCLNNYANILRTAGSSWDDIFETTWHLTDQREWEKVSAVAAEWFGRPVPNPTVVEVPKFVLPGVRIEIDMWGTVPARTTH